MLLEIFVKGGNECLAQFVLAALGAACWIGYLTRLEWDTPLLFLGIC